MVKLANQVLIAQITRLQGCTFETLSDQKSFNWAISTRLRLSTVDLPEKPLKLLKEESDIASPEYFRHESATLDEQSGRDIECSHHQLVLHVRVKVVVAEDVRCAITYDQVHSRVLEDQVDLFYGFLAGNVTLYRGCTVYLRDFEQVNWA